MTPKSSKADAPVLPTASETKEEPISKKRAVTEDGVEDPKKRKVELTPADDEDDEDFDFFGIESSEPTDTQPKSTSNERISTTEIEDGAGTSGKKSKPVTTANSAYKIVDGHTLNDATADSNDSEDSSNDEPTTRKIDFEIDGRNQTALADDELADLQEKGAGESRKLSDHIWKQKQSLGQLAKLAKRYQQSK